MKNDKIIKRKMYARKLLINASEHFITEEYNRGCIPSDMDLANMMCSYDSHCLGNENLDLVRELSKELGEKYFKEGKIYKHGDWNSYLTNVSNRGLISTTENRIVKYLNNKEQIIKDRFGKMEFPVNENGYYRSPTEQK